VHFLLHKLVQYDCTCKFLVQFYCTSLCSTTAHVNLLCSATAQACAVALHVLNSFFLVHFLLHMIVQWKFLCAVKWTCSAVVGGFRVVSLFVQSELAAESITTWSLNFACIYIYIYIYICIHRYIYMRTCHVKINDIHSGTLTNTHAH
jgi:hypothetical protein